MLFCWCAHSFFFLIPVCPYFGVMKACLSSTAALACSSVGVVVERPRTVLQSGLASGMLVCWVTEFPNLPLTWI